MDDTPSEAPPRYSKVLEEKEKEKENDMLKNMIRLNAIIFDSIRERKAIQEANMDDETIRNAAMPPIVMPDPTWEMPPFIEECDMPSDRILTFDIKPGETELNRLTKTGKYGEGQDHLQLMKTFEVLGIARDDERVPKFCQELGIGPEHETYQLLFSQAV